MALAYFGMREPVGRLEKNDKDTRAVSALTEKLADEYNDEGLKLEINGSDIDKDKYLPHLNSDLRVMLPLRTVKDKLKCSVDKYANGSVIIGRNDRELRIVVDSLAASSDGNDLELQTAPVNIDGEIYVPIEDISESVDYTCEYNYETGRVSLEKMVRI